ncbi:hypothetical protein F5148DRAFT_1150122 [Russula earlei]|uniref:Uncharacterized protein n=1 Tax=Russula earlei TaxID=71964 RepID=A0ACC0U5J9_9AGAM|nr:hypothetical protein F5148DRAFT_1150122 [Russula earlei]
MPFLHHERMCSRRPLAIFNGHNGGMSNPDDLDLVANQEPRPGEASLHRYVVRLQKPFPRRRRERCTDGRSGTQGGHRLECRPRLSSEVMKSEKVEFVTARYVEVKPLSDKESLVRRTKGKVPASAASAGRGTWVAVVSGMKESIPAPSRQYCRMPNGAFIRAASGTDVKGYISNAMRKGSKGLGHTFVLRAGMMGKPPIIIARKRPNVPVALVPTESARDLIPHSHASEGEKELGPQGGGAARRQRRAHGIPTGNGKGRREAPGGTVEHAVDDSGSGTTATGTTDSPHVRIHVGGRDDETETGGGAWSLSAHMGTRQRQAGPTTGNRH